MKEFELQEGMKLIGSEPTELSTNDKTELVLFDRFLALLSIRGYHDTSLDFVQRAKIMRETYESVYNNPAPRPIDQAFVNIVGDKLNGL